MTKETILLAIGDIPDELIEDAALPAAPARRSHWTRWTALAACLAVVVVGIFAARYFTGSRLDSADAPGISGAASGEQQVGGEAQQAGGVTIPRTEFTLGLDDGAAVDMIAFFIYGGRSYVHYENIDGQYADTVIGEHLGYATGLINEWTPRDGYVELAGSVEGDFYAIRGFDPGFMLCMRWATGDVALYVNDNGMTLYTGADLYEDRLHLSENYTGLTYETHDSWNEGPEELQALSPDHDPAVRNFIAALDAAPFLPREAIPETEGQSFYDVLETYHVYFQTPSGVPVHIRLLDGGYVIFTGLYSVCVQVDAAAYDAFVSLLNTAGVPAEETELSDFEQCQLDPVFGPYMPATAPDQYATLYYVLDPETGAVLDTRKVELGYTNGGNGASWYLTYLRPGEEEEGEPVLAPEELSTEALDALRRTGAGGRVLAFSVQVDDILISFHGYGEPVDVAFAMDVMGEILDR